MSELFDWLNAQIETDEDLAKDVHEFDCRYIEGLYDDRFVGALCNCYIPDRLNREIFFKEQLLGQIIAEADDNLDNPTAIDQMLTLAGVYSNREGYEELLKKYGGEAW